MSSVEQPPCLSIPVNSSRSGDGPPRLAVRVAPVVDEMHPQDRVVDLVVQELGVGLDAEMVELPDDRLDEVFEFGQILRPREARAVAAALVWAADEVERAGGLS